MRVIMKIAVKTVFTITLIGIIIMCIGLLHYLWTEV